MDGVIYCLQCMVNDKDVAVRIEPLLNSDSANTYVIHGWSAIPHEDKPDNVSWLDVICSKAGSDITDEIGYATYQGVSRIQKKSNRKYEAFTSAR